MKNFFLLLLTVSSTALLGQTTINTILKDFSTVKVYNGIDLEFVKSEEQRIEITGEKSDKVKVKQKNGTIKITMRFPETTADGTVKATLYFNKNISEIEANEGSTVTGKGITQQSIIINAQKGAFVNMVVKIKDLKVKSISGGVVKLSGTAKNQTINVGLGGVYYGYNLTAEDLSVVKVGSGGRAEVKAIKTLEAKASFGGTVFYKGNPKIIKESKVIGGTIEQRN